MPPPTHLQAALETRVAAGAPGALARIEAPGVGRCWEGSAGQLARRTGRALRPDDGFRAATGRPLHTVYREPVFDPLGMDQTWLEGHEPARTREAAHHYTGELDWTTISPTIDWAGGGLVTTAPDLARGAFAFYAPDYDAVLVGTHNASHVDRWPLVTALCQALRDVGPA